MTEVKEFNHDESGPGPVVGGEISRRELLKKLSPFGRVELDASQCTGCGLCAQECTTEALTVFVDSTTGVFQLLFRHSNCLACGQCVEICPEECLHMVRILEPDEMKGKSVLFEDEIVRCSQCGGPVGPKVMIDKIKDRMDSYKKSLVSRLELCPECKTRSQFGQLSINNGRIA